MSRFDDHFIDELKARLRPSDVIGKTVKLRRAGREYSGLSPFTKEKSPSFFVNDEKGFYHCFSSGKHGDIIEFLVETERLSFPEAVERLAAEAGMALPAADPQAAEMDRRRASLTDWLDLATTWFEAQLRRPVGQGARAYLEGRGLPESEWSRFKIGYAPEGRTALKDYLVAKGARPGELVAAGILVDEENGTAPFDRFRDRIIFPITDARGKIISFGGRALNPSAKAKYLNGPETVLFDKGRTLYGLFEARRIQHAGGVDADLAVVEGYMDVIACQRAGIAAVAPMGTALTEGQMLALWRFHHEPTLCFDGDAAGQRAAWRAIERALPLLEPRRTFKFTLPVGGKDPDDVLREQGVAALVAQLRQTRPLVELLFEHERAVDALATPEQRAGLRGRLRLAARTIQHADLSSAYMRDLMGRYDAQFQDLRRGQGPRGRWAAPKAGATPELKVAASTLASGRPTIDTILAKSEVSPAESALFDLLTEQEDVDRRIADARARLAEPGALDELVALKAERGRVAEAVKAARFQDQGAAA
ncbi:DNA primase [Caulobacter sp. Root343]|uniref:DNA primase n=1 Tax=Caulobacter sp. Root343 TaxID=1736520 RepID=UPI0009E9813A|nr:DNA primase [Caulobacter sp. Root343]